MASEFFAPLMIGISIVSILYGGFVALGQNDIKKLVAYSSVAHMGFVTLGIFLFDLQGVQGALLQMLNHGIITGALFMMIGTIYERSHSREISKNLGLGKYLPAFMGFWGLFALASLSFPGTNGFVGEVLVFAAAFRVDPVVGALIVPGALLGAAYMFRVSLKMAWGTPASPVADDDDHGHDAHAEAESAAPEAVAETAHGGHGHHDDGRESKWPDLNRREWTYLVIPAVLVIMIGLAPTPFLGLVTPSVDKLLSDYNIRSNKVVQARFDGSAVARSTALARSAVQLVLEPGRASEAAGINSGTTAPVTDTTPDPRADAALAVDTMTVAANQGESQ